MEKLNIVGSKRRNYLIDKKFQIRFILRFCALIALGGLLTVGIVYLLAMQSTSVAFLNSRVVVRSTADFILPVLLQTVILVLVIIGFLTVAMTLFVSHKIAGPMYRFKKVMENLAAGDFSHEFKIRRLDQMQDIADTFNIMIVTIKAELKEIKENLRSLKKNVDCISENEVSEHKRVCLAELKRVSQELDRITGYFKT